MSVWCLGICLFFSFFSFLIFILSFRFITFFSIFISFPFSLVTYLIRMRPLSPAITEAGGKSDLPRVCSWPHLGAATRSWRHVDVLSAAATHVICSINRRSIGRGSCSAGAKPRKCICAHTQQHLLDTLINTRAYMRKRTHMYTHNRKQTYTYKCAHVTMYAYAHLNICKLSLSLALHLSIYLSI